jgi:hypothetical protein
MVKCFLDNTNDASGDEIAEMYGLPVDAVRRSRKRAACSAARKRGGDHPPT